MFNTNLLILAIEQLPFELRKAKNMSWLKVLTSSIVKLKSDFDRQREEDLFLIAHNSQVISLEHFLNYKFNPNPDAKDIYITDGETKSETYLYETPVINDQVYLYEEPVGDEIIYLYTTSSPLITGFVINIPSTFNIDEFELKAYVNRLKLAGKSYALKYY